MRRTQPVLTLLLCLALALAACTPAPGEVAGVPSATHTPAPPSDTVAPTATAQPSDTPEPSITPLPSETFTPAPSATPTRRPPTATPTVLPTPDGPWLATLPEATMGTSCRYGPDFTYGWTGSLPYGGWAGVVGKSADGLWFQIIHPRDPSQFCWFNKDEVEVHGDTSGLPVVPAPPGLVVVVDQFIPDDPVKFTACGEANYMIVHAEIKANGPVNVTYHWELTGPRAVVSPDGHLSFDDFSGYYDSTIEVAFTINPLKAFELVNAPCGDYVLKLIAVGANTLIAERAFTLPLDCGPLSC